MSIIGIIFPPLNNFYYIHNIINTYIGIPGQHSGSIASLASANYYGTATSGAEQHSPAKYPENGHDTLSDFVTFVCQEAESSQGAQVCNITTYYKKNNIMYLLLL